MPRERKKMTGLRPTLSALLAALALPAAAQDPKDPPGFRLGGEIKLHFRHSKDVAAVNRFPFPPSFIPPGQTQVFFRTVDPGSSLELSTATLRGEGEITSGVSVKVEVHVLDLYNRNPTSSDDRVFVREAWLRLGRAYAPLVPAPGTSFYFQAGIAPRFTRPSARRLETYGLWGTAVGRFESPQVQIGGTFGRALYWRASVGNGNPLFFRDPNALAGDNGTPERQPGAVDPVYESGFPILYDAKPSDLNVDGEFEAGAGLGLKVGDEKNAVDVLAFYFERELADRARVRGTSYGGDLQLLRGPGEPLPFEGNERRELGLNVEARTESGLRLFAQYVDQEIARLPRRGFEGELAWRLGWPAPFRIGDTSVLNWIQPALRVSRIDNDFAAPRAYPAASVAWDWTKYDLGLRIGLVPDVDLTIEYSRNDVTLASGKIHPDETVVMLRAGF
jgi:hypothetical protein